MPLTAAVYTQSDSWQLMALSVRFFTATGHQPRGLTTVWANVHLGKPPGQWANPQGNITI